MLQKTIEEVYEDFLIGKIIYIEQSFVKEILQHLLDRGWKGFSGETDLQKLLKKSYPWNSIQMNGKDSFMFCISSVEEYDLVRYKLNFKQIVLENKIKFVDNVMILPEGFTYVLQNNMINIYEN